MMNFRFALMNDDYNTLIKLIRQCFEESYFAGTSLVNTCYEVIERINEMYNKGIGNDSQIKELNKYTIDLFNLYRNFRKDVGEVVRNNFR